MDTTSPLHVQLDAFDGPFDLLFHLIEKNEIDIYDIPMATLTGQYLETIAALPPDMEDMSAFLVMAATLLEIKTRMLLPRPEKAATDEEGEDPREALVQKLLAYKACQALAEQLKAQPFQGQRLFKGADKTLLRPPPPPTTAWLEGISLEALATAFADVMQRKALKVDTVRSQYGTVARDRFTLEEKAAYLCARVREAGEVPLSRLFDECEERRECLVTFLALLEMIKAHKVSARQENNFADVIIFAV